MGRFFEVVNLKSDKMGSCYIIAEIGVNHNGNVSLLKDLIRSAKKSGADACKFQTFSAERLVSQNTPKVPYQLNTSSHIETHFEMIKKLEMSDEMHLVAMETCKNNDIDFISTAYSPEDVKYLIDLKIKKIKTASADVVDLRIHKEIALNQLDVFVAVGMATEDEISDMLTCYKHTKMPTLLHCVSNYPCALESLNLRAMRSLQKKFNTPVGFSDHSVGSQSAVIAVAQGATVVEKHYTLDKNLPGPDHLASSTPEEFLDLVSRIREAELILGSENKSVQNEELDMRSISRKSAFSKVEIRKGEIITEDKITMMRPGGGISGSEYYSLCRKKKKINITQNTFLTHEMFEF